MAQCSMAHPRKSPVHGSTDQALSRASEPAITDTIDPRTFGFTKAAYAVGEALDLLSIGRTSLYAAVKRGDLRRVKFGKKTLFFAADLAAFLAKLRRPNEPDAQGAGDTPNAPKGSERS
jgi:excisionase family DNA binding protein